ncbi:10548_t:CDS:1 [Ambispora gerdemannii]|uniref:10548_t:CDS:1 n=1 Tax=Ambispora gerdemannii TaxID=144530 RepID=A0A9N9CZQ1_9GLOM|nr:10548_t:CDS:1 [Ambispora gerdemannii]
MSKRKKSIMRAMLILEFVILVPIAIVALYLKCQQISITLAPIISQNVINLFQKNYLETLKIIISFAGFTLNIAYLQKLPNMDWWLMVHHIENVEFYNLLADKKGKWYTIRVLLKYDTALSLDKLFWKALQSVAD